MAEEGKRQDDEQKKKGKKDEADGESDGKPKKRFSVKLIAIVLVAVAVLGGGGFFAWQKFLAGGEGGEGGHGKAQASSHGEGEEAITTYPLEVFIVNLVDPLGRRYLKAKIELELDSPAAAEEVAKRTPQIRDSIITLLTSKSYTDIEGTEGKLQLRQEVIARVNQFLHNGKATNAYLTDFVVQ